MRRCNMDQVYLQNSRPSHVITTRYSKLENCQKWIEHESLHCLLPAKYGEKKVKTQNKKRWNYSDFKVTLCNCQRKHIYTEYAYRMTLPQKALSNREIKKSLKRKFINLKYVNAFNAQRKIFKRSLETNVFLKCNTVDVKSDPTTCLELGTNKVMKKNFILA